jgi:DNA-binding HxlR family transcriptional regulator
MARDAGQIEAFQLGAEACPIFAATELIGERWSFLILRGALLGLCHFEEYQACLGIARNILSDRLGRLVRAGILTRTPDPKDRRKLIYGLTERGAALLPVLIAIRQWGIESGLAKPGHPTLSDRRDRKPVRRLAVQAHDGRELDLEDLVWIDSNGDELPIPLPARARKDAA